MIAVLVPTRGRPENLRSLMQAFKDTLDPAKDAKLITCIDLDDPELENYKKVWIENNGDSLGVLEVGERLRLGGTLNHYAPKYAEKYEVIGFMGDDHRPRTKHWDLWINGYHSENKLAVTYGNDLLQGSRLATAVFLDSRIIKTLGYMIFPGGVHLFLDNFWMSLGQGLGTLRYFNDIIIEHMHPVIGKAVMDDRYVEVNSPAVWSHDEALYLDYMSNKMPQALELLRGVQ